MANALVRDRRRGAAAREEAAARSGLRRLLAGSERG